MTEETIRKKKLAGLCIVPFCKRKVDKRNRQVKCNTCKSRELDDKNPMKRCYRNLKCHAKQRRKPFTLSFEDFQRFAIETDYINKRGVQAFEYTIDRINNRLGYVLSNIRCLTNSQNASKGTREEILQPF